MDGNFEVEKIHRKQTFQKKNSSYVFAKQGVYMLMTVLQGDLAVKQSKALIRAFKQTKDYIIKSKTCY